MEKKHQPIKFKFNTKKFIRLARKAGKNIDDRFMKLEKHVKKLEHEVRMLKKQVNK